MNHDSPLSRVTLQFWTILSGLIGSVSSFRCWKRDRERRTGDQLPAHVAYISPFSSQSPPISVLLVLRRSCMSALVHPSITLHQDAPRLNDKTNGGLANGAVRERPMHLSRHAAGKVPTTVWTKAAIYPRMLKRARSLDRARHTKNNKKNSK